MQKALDGARSNRVPSPCWSSCQTTHQGQKPLQKGGALVALTVSDILQAANGEIYQIYQALECETVKLFLLSASCWTAEIHMCEWLPFSRFPELPRFSEALPMLQRSVEAGRVKPQAIFCIASQAKTGGRCLFPS